MGSGLTVNVIGNSLDDPRGYGWSTDARIVCEVLRAAGFVVTPINAHFYWGEGLLNDLRARAAREWLGLRRRLGARKHLNVFLERVPHQFFSCARRHVLIPNQEWFLDRWRRHLPRFDAVICKTHAAEEAFHALGCKTFFSSFTSPDRRLDLPCPKRREFLFIAGRRTGVADRILPVWARHPEWPCLTLCGQRLPDGISLPNVRLLRDYLAEAEIVRLQNETLFHLALTKAEGFGHKLNEGLSCGAIVITTDAPPMNEIVAPPRGLLVPAVAARRKALGVEYEFDPTAFEKAVRVCLELNPAELTRMTTAARTWFEQNDGFFRATLPRLLRDITRI